jgi:hypothetical protein
MRLVSMATLIATTACSLQMVRGPGDPSGRTRPSCTQDSPGPKIDIGVGTAAGLGGIASGVAITDGTGVAAYSLIGAGVLSLLAFYGSATLGIVRVRRCRDAVNEWNFHAPSGSEIDTPE